MGKAFQGEAVVNLPRALNNADHGRLLLARRVKSFQAVHQFFNVTYCITAGWIRIHVKTLILFLFIRLLKGFQAMFGLCQVPAGLPHETADGDVARTGAFGSMIVQVGQMFPDIRR